MASPQSEWARPVGKNSAIWDHFEENSKDKQDKKDPIRARCIHCPATFRYSGSTTNFWRHMRIQHANIKIGTADASSSAGEGTSASSSTPQKKESRITTFLLKMDNRETRAKVIIYLAKSNLKNGLGKTSF